MSRLIWVVGALGGILVYLSTPYGIGASPDSTIYIQAAENFVTGHGFSVSRLPNIYQPLTQFPPFYSFSLALFSNLSGTPYDAARLLAIFIFMVNILLVGYILYKINPEAHWSAIVGSLLISVAPPMLGIHVMAWSEPLFLLLSFLVILTLSKSLENRNFPWLLIAAILSSLAALTRYAGIALVVTGVLGILFLSQKSKTQRIVDAMLYSIIGVVPLLALLIHNQAITGSATNRSLVFHPISSSLLLQGIKTITFWLGIPNQLSGWIHLLILSSVVALLLILAFMIVRKDSSIKYTLNFRKMPFHPIIVLMFFFICIYALFLIFSISFIDANTPLDDRILSPAYSFTLIIIISLIAQFLRSQKSSALRFGMMIILSLILGSYLSFSIPFVSAARANGIGYSTLAWKNSELIEQIKTISPLIALYSNNPEAIILHTDHSAVRLPRVFEPSSQQNNPKFASELLEIGEKMANGEALIVYFNQSGRAANPSIREIEKIPEIQPQIRAVDGEIYALVEPIGK